MRFEPLEIVPGDERQYRIALQRDDAPESSGQHQRVDAQAAGQIDAQSAFVSLRFGCRFAAGLLERQRRNDAAGPVIGRQFRFGPLEVFDLRR